METDNYVYVCVFLISFAFLIVSLVKRKERKKYKTTGIKTIGIISEVILEASDQKLYFPIVNYETLEKIEVMKKCDIGTNPSLYKKGQKVTIIYQQENHEEFIIDDKNHETIEALFLIIGLLGMLISGFYLIEFYTA